MRAGTDERHPFFRLLRAVGQAASTWHAATLEGLEYLPNGPALLVGNHGLLGWDSLVFFYLLHRETGELPVGMADRKVFGGWPLRDLLHVVGGVPGTPENARAALRANRWVVSYPGGSREVFKAPALRYRLAWDHAEGFARVALTENVPVVPFAGLGVDDVFFNFGHAPLSRELIGRYAVPLTLGLGPLPLPVNLRFRLAPPIHPAVAAGRVDVLKRLVQREVESLLEGSGELADRTAHSVP